MKIASLKWSISEHEIHARELRAQNEKLTMELTPITEGISHYAKRKEFLSVCARYLHDIQTKAS